MDAGSPSFFDVLCAVHRARPACGGALPTSPVAAHSRRAAGRPRRSVAGFLALFSRVTDREKCLTEKAQPIPLEFGAKTPCSDAVKQLGLDGMSVSLLRRM